MSAQVVWILTRNNAPEDAELQCWRAMYAQACPRPAGSVNVTQAA